MAKGTTPSRSSVENYEGERRRKESVEVVMKWG